MATRNLIMVVSKGVPKIAQYGQWDGYLEGVGMEVLIHLRKIDMVDFRKKVDSLVELSDVDLSTLKELDLYSKRSINVTAEGGLRLKIKYPQASRDCCANIIPLVASGTVTKVILHPEFAEDSLYCEYCYVIDLDKETFEVYKGFNRDPLTQDDRFFHLQKLEDDTEFFPVRIMGLYRLDDLPDDETFLKTGIDYKIPFVKAE